MAVYHPQSENMLLSGRCVIVIIVLCAGVLPGLSRALSHSAGPSSPVSSEPLPVYNSRHQEVQHPSTMTVGVNSEFIEFIQIYEARYVMFNFIIYSFHGTTFAILPGKEY